MELAVRKWLTTHGPEEEALRGQYVLRVSHCLEFLCGDHQLIQYKVSVYAVALSGVTKPDFRCVKPCVNIMFRNSRERILIKSLTGVSIIAQSLS